MATPGPPPDPSILDNIKNLFNSGKEAFSKFTPSSSYTPETTYNEYRSQMFGFNRMQFLFLLFVFIIVVIVFYSNHPKISKNYFVAFLVFFGFIALVTLIYFNFFLSGGIDSKLTDIYNPITYLKYFLYFSLFAAFILLIAWSVHDSKNQYTNAFIIMAGIMVSFTLLYYTILNTTSYTDNGFSDFSNPLTFLKYALYIGSFAFYILLIAWVASQHSKIPKEYYGVFVSFLVLISVFTPIYFLFYSDSHKKLGLSDFLLPFLDYLKYALIAFFLILFVSYILLNFNWEMSMSIVFCIVILCLYLFKGQIYNILFSNTQNQIYENEPFLASLKYAFMFFMFCFFSIFLLSFAIISAGKINSITSFTSLLVNIVAVLIMMFLVYKVLSYSTIFQSAPLFRLVLNTILYIPCIIGGFFQNLFWELFWMFKIKPFGTGSTRPQMFSFSSFTQALVKEYEKTKYSYIVMLGLSGLLFGGYFGYPYLGNKYLLQGGNQLLDDPIYLNGEKTLGTYEQLNGSDTFNYQYGISFWFYLDSNNTNTANIPILSYGHKPAVFYNPSKNLLEVQVEEKNESLTNEMVTIYQKTDIYLQKWNHMIINYVGGTLDIFLNGDLVKSAINIVPFMKLDTLVVGHNNGINGGICNVIYFNKPLVAGQIQNLYNLLKNKTPPSSYSTNQVNLQNEFREANTGDDIVNEFLQEKGKDASRIVKENEAT